MIEGVDNIRHQAFDDDKITNKVSFNKDSLLVKTTLIGITDAVNGRT